MTEINYSLSINDFREMNSVSQRQELARLLSKDFSSGELRALKHPQRIDVYANMYLGGTVTDVSGLLISYQAAIPVPVTGEPVRASKDDKSELERIKELLGVNDKQEAELDTEAVKELIAAALRDFQAPNIVNIIKADQPVIECGLQHRNFGKLAKAMSARDSSGVHLNVWLTGEAGTGKTFALRKIAETMGLDFAYTGAIPNEYKLTGFKDANGNYDFTPLRKIYEKGGVFLLDEVDSSHPTAVLAFNTILSESTFMFPDGMAKRHENCIFVAASNTFDGATANFNGRYKMDGAIKSRFVRIKWETDNALEMGFSVNKEWCRFVQSVRVKAQERYKGIVIDSRNTLQGEALIASGLDIDSVIDMTFGTALSDEQIKAVCGYDGFSFSEAA